jgi:predicted O-methyltransferase YrrM
MPDPIPTRLDQLVVLARGTRGFMPDDEGAALLDWALRAGRAFAEAEVPACFVEIGAWCGKSSIYLGAAAESTGALLFSVDHHRGSEENQAGWEYHQPDLVDPVDGRIDTLPYWRRAMASAGLEHCVVGVIGDSPTVAARWETPLALCFIDGGHGAASAHAELGGWGPRVRVGGWLAIHDVFPDPADGGRPPYEIWLEALRSGDWVEDGARGSLRVLRRIRPSSPASESPVRTSPTP